jgi:hypothetical protein
MLITRVPSVSVRQHPSERQLCRRGAFLPSDLIQPPNQLEIVGDPVCGRDRRQRFA